MGNTSVEYVNKSLTEKRGFLTIANCILLCTDLIIAQNAIKILILKTY
jgi:hypothetical protein